MSTSRNSTPLYEGIRSLVMSARQSAARGVNLLQVYTNYEIGRRIFEQEQQGAFLTRGMSFFSRLPRIGQSAVTLY